MSHSKEKLLPSHSEVTVPDQNLSWRGFSWSWCLHYLISQLLRNSLLHSNKI